VTRATAAAVTVRTLQGDAELDAYFSLAAETFGGYHAVHCTPTADGLAAGWRHFNETAPGFQPGYLRGAFVGDALAGGCIHDERWLRLEGTTLRTGYIGGLVTQPAQRGLGVASSLMRDSLDRARRGGQALLVLQGIPDFYHRFGYADVIDLTEHAVEVERIPSAANQEVAVGLASIADAPALLDLYDRHFCRYAGAYARSLDQQEHLLRHRSSPPVIAVDGAGRARGYLLLPCRPDRSLAAEVAADTWPATLALLQHHARSLDSGPTELRWPLPPGSPTHHHLADNLPVTSRTISRPDAGWMARPGDLGALFAGLLPVWRQRWERLRTQWAGQLGLETDGQRVCLELSDGALRRVDRLDKGGILVHLTAPVLAQLVFGYRPVAWATSRLDRTIPDPALAPLGVLFPTLPAWYAASNRC
jgi:GNAT superfamily N-acetyltransferase